MSRRLVLWRKKLMQVMQVRCKHPESGFDMRDQRLPAQGAEFNTCIARVQRVGERGMRETAIRRLASGLYRKRG